MALSNTLRVELFSSVLLRTFLHMFRPIQPPLSSNPTTSFVQSNHLFRPIQPLLACKMAFSNTVRVELFFSVLRFYTSFVQSNRNHLFCPIQAPLSSNPSASLLSSSNPTASLLSSSNPTAASELMELGGAPEGVLLSFVACQRCSFHRIIVVAAYKSPGVDKTKRTWPCPGR